MRVSEAMISLYERSRRIQWIRSAAKKDSPQPITHVGGINRDGSRWELPLEQVIREVESGESAFYIDYDGQSWRVGIYLDTRGTKHLGTFVAGRAALSMLPEMLWRA